MLLSHWLRQVKIRRSLRRRTRELARLQRLRHRQTAAHIELLEDRTLLATVGYCGVDDVAIVATGTAADEFTVEEYTDATATCTGDKLRVRSTSSFTVTHDTTTHTVDGGAGEFAYFNGTIDTITIDLGANDGSAPDLSLIHI